MESSPILAARAAGATWRCWGYLEMLVLLGVLLRIEQISGGALEIQQGALYPALYRLAHQELIESEWGKSENTRRAKFYRLTTAGRGALGEEEASWERLVAAMTAAMSPTPQEV